MAPHSSTLAWKIPMDGGAWWAAVHGIAKSRTRLSDFTFTFSLSCIGEGNGSPGWALPCGTGSTHFSWRFRPRSALPNLSRCPAQPRPPSQASLPSLVLTALRLLLCDFSHQNQQCVVARAVCACLLALMSGPSLPPVLPHGT